MPIRHLIEQVWQLYTSAGTTVRYVEYLEWTLRRPSLSGPYKCKAGHCMYYALCLDGVYFSIMLLCRPPKF